MMLTRVLISSDSYHSIDNSCHAYSFMKQKEFITQNSNYAFDMKNNKIKILFTLV